MPDFTNGSTAVYYSKFNSDGSLGTWLTSVNSLPIGRKQLTTVYANGYIYSIAGGSDDTIYYTSVGRVVSSGQALADSLTALAETVTTANAALRQRLALEDHAEPIPQLPEPAEDTGKRRGRKAE